MGSLPNLHELCKQRPACSPAPPSRLSPYPERGATSTGGGGGGGGGGGATVLPSAATATGGAGGGGRAHHHRRLLQTNSLCTSNFYGVIDRQADMQINEVIVVM